ncbi:death domain-containing protein 1 [Notolabrus celidotus]|uniref:death domain-containing protein 1 n=1 Tax=Notolabrus celidotus TaxID=1203425 RepID=UPI00148FF1FB|nr:death domain-containing protein 1 [Notolabrus celidotus]
MDEADSLHGRRKEETLLKMLTETFQGLEAVRHCRDHHNETVGGIKSTGEEAGRGGGGGGERMHSPGGKYEGKQAKTPKEEQDEEECKKKVVGLLRELSVFHSERVTAWRDVLGEFIHIFNKPPPGGSEELQPSSTGQECEVPLSSDTFTDSFLRVEEDIKKIMDILNSITSKLDKEILILSSQKASTEDSAFQETRGPQGSEQLEDDKNYSHDALEFDSGQKQDIEVGDDQRNTKPSPDTVEKTDERFYKSDCNTEEEKDREQAVKSQGSYNEDCLPADSQTDFQEETKNDLNMVKEKGKEETNNKWVTVGLTGQHEDTHSDVQDACFIKAPMGVAELLRCEVANALSGLMVTGSEELVSRVIRVEVQNGAHFHFPVTLVVPFCARYRGNYRDVAVKVVNGERRVSYVTPVTTEGTYGGQRGSFAEVRVYSLGLFAVVSCLKIENYTVPTKGVSLKLPMDHRICLNYLPGSFTAPIMAQTMIQPIDAVLLAAVKSRSDVFHSVVSTSPLLYLTHPSSLPLRRPLTFNLPCPPNPEKKRHRRVQEEDQDHQIWPVSASPTWDQPASQRGRILAASVKSKEMSDEPLVVLGSRDKQWSVLDKVPVRNQQNGLVSFELMENFDKLLVVRLLSQLQPCHLISLAEELEESVCCHTVTIILQRKLDEPHTVLVAALPSRDLNWELSKLKAQGYSSLPEVSSESCMCEGDQLLLSFSGNITSKGTQKHQQRLTFHSQQKNHLLLHLTEVDQFGNYSSPHYKGTAVFYKVTRGQLEWQGDKPVQIDTKVLGEPICKLSLTLPKKVRTINRPIMARAKLCEEAADSLSDSLLLWLSGELSEEEVALLVLSLRLRRSAAQLVKLRAGDSLSSQAFHVLAMWRRGLPAATHQPKASQLAHCLAKSGRPDLARELLLRQSGASRQSLQKQGSLKSRNNTPF